MTKKTLYKLFVSASIIFDFALGFFSPFWFLYASKFSGGIEEFSYGLFFMTLASAITAYFSGYIADRLGMRMMLIVSGVGVAGTIIGYVFIESLWSFYVLQILYGVLLSAYSVAEIAYTAEVTEELSRGKDVGTLRFFTQLAAACAILIAGLVGSKFGINVIFVSAALLNLISVFVIAFPSFKPKRNIPQE